MDVIETLNWYRQQALSLAIHASGIKDMEAIVACVTLLANDGGCKAESAIKQVQDIAALNLTKHRCTSGHMFFMSPAHPMYQGQPRCPFCMSMRLDRIREQANEVNGVFHSKRRE